MQSPCVKICVVDPDSGLCIGCGRTRDEVAGWLAMSDIERKTCMDELAGRLAGLTSTRRRKGGRRARRAVLAGER